MATEDQATAEAQRVMALLGASEASAPQQVPELPGAGPNADTEAARVMSLLSGEKPAASQPRTPPTPGAPQAPMTVEPTMRQVARTPPKKPEPELTWAETGKQALTNLPRSTYEMGKSMVGAIANYDQTIEGLKQVGRGLMSKASGAVGVEQTPDQKAAQEAALDRIIDQYKQTYGSEAGFKRALANDPATILADMSTLISGGATALGKTGITSAKTASQISKAGSYLDPVANSVRVAKSLTSGAMLPVKMTQAGLSGVPVGVMNIAKTAAATDDPALRQAFLKFYRGEGTPADFMSTAQDALRQVRADVSSNYLSSRGRLANVSPSFQRVDDAIDKMRNDVRLGGVRAGQFSDANQALDTLENIVNAWKNNPNPTNRTLLGFDNLKQAIWDLRDSHGSSAAQRHLGDIYNAAKEAIVDVDPTYAQLMENYSTAQRNMNDIVKTMGIGNKAAASAAISKNLRNLKADKGQDVLEQLAQYKPELPFMLAGAALNPWSAGGWRNTVETMMAFPSAMLVHPLAPVGQFIGQSPRIAGATSYAAGKVGKAVDKAISPEVRGALYGAGIASEAAGAQPVIAPQEAAATEGVTPAVVEQIRKVEGEGQNPESSARGPFQFVDQTFVDAFRKFYPDQSQSMTREEILDLKNSPEGASIAEQMGPMLIEDNANIISRAGHPSTPGNVYLAHFLGATDALKVLGADPSTPVDQLLPAKVINANERLLRGKTAGEVRDMMQQMMQPAAAYGGRMGRRAGGRVDNVETLVAQLMTRVKSAKQETQKMTEPLLNQPDEHIVKALDVAQQAS